MRIDLRVRAWSSSLGIHQRSRARQPPLARFAIAGHHLQIAQQFGGRGAGCG